MQLQLWNDNCNTNWKPNPPPKEIPPFPSLLSSVGERIRHDVSFRLLWWWWCYGRWEFGVKVNWMTFLEIRFELHGIHANKQSSCSQSHMVLYSYCLSVDLLDLGSSCVCVVVVWRSNVRRFHHTPVVYKRKNNCAIITQTHPRVL